jgi:hypothetical protein
MSLATDIATLNTDVGLMHSIVQGGATDPDVSTEGGLVPTLAKRLAQIATGVSRGAWVTATAYALNDVVIQGGTTYRCTMAHTSSVFATDLATPRWTVQVIEASLLEVLIPGTTTPRSLAVRFGAVYHPEDYGAAGDGVADDTAEINAAILAADAAGGGDVELGLGTFLVSGNLEMKDNVRLRGRGVGTVLKCNADTVLGLLLCEGISHFHISDLAIDGGGQTVDVSTGIKACQAIRIDNCFYFSVERVSIYKCGIKNAAAPATDSAHAGLGILVSALSGECAYGVIRDCRIREIAGGGVANGDGIEIAGYGTAGNLAHDILVDNCWVSTCGRHCYSAAGLAASGLPDFVEFRSCYAEGSALDGIDIEDATRTTVINCKFVSCGNDQTYYDPVAIYGATYRLLAAIAINAVECEGTTIIGCRFNSCYYGVSQSAALGLIVSDCEFRNGTHDDLKMGGAQTANRATYRGCRFLSTADNEIQVTYRAADGGKAVAFRDCEFAKKFRVSQSYNLLCDGCTFQAGVAFVSTDINRPTFIACTFNDFAGAGVSNSALGQYVTDAAFIGCQFVGAGAMTAGIVVSYHCAKAWRVESCVFTGQTTYGIRHDNSEQDHCFASIANNKFRSCGSGISINQSPMHGVIHGNQFESITGYCIEVLNIQAGTPMEGMTITNNVAGASVTNGLRVTLSGGTWDWCLVTGNNMHTASGTKWTLPAGNANGLSTGNLTT